MFGRVAQGTTCAGSVGGGRIKPSEVYGRKGGRGSKSMRQGESQCASLIVFLCVQIQKGGGVAHGLESRADTDWVRCLGALSHPRNSPQSPALFEYWGQKQGIDLKKQAKNCVQNRLFQIQEAFKRREH